jgi:hypothetical protein
LSASAAGDSSAIASRAIGMATGPIGLVSMVRQRRCARDVESALPFRIFSRLPEPRKRTMADPTQTYLEPTQDSGRAFVIRGIAGSVVMLNLLRFRPRADYSATPDLAPQAPITGAAAYRRYMEHTMPHLARSGGQMIFLGGGGPFLIGPPGEHWDAAMLVRQSSVAAFIAFASNPAYMAGIGHRLAALADARLLPLVEGSAADLFPDATP